MALQNNPKHLYTAKRLGLGTPQANPTVEAEMRRLIPPEVEYCTVRLTSDSPDSSERLCKYMLNLPEFVRRFATLKLNGFMFACTASSYLLDSNAIDEIVSTTTDIINAPVFLASDAIKAWLNARKAERIALISPYPDWLNQKATQFWQACGFELVTLDRVNINSEDTNAIYALKEADAEATVLNCLDNNVDAFVITGTGMPSLGLLKKLRAENIPIVSSNTALAELALNQIGAGVETQTG